MADSRPAAEASTAEVMREAQLVRVLDLIVNSGLSQVEACQQVEGMTLRTFQRSIASSNVLAELRKQTDGILASGVLAAYKGYLRGIEKLAEVIEDGETKPRDLVTAVKLLHQILQGFGGGLTVLVPPVADDADGEGRRVQVAFNSDLLLRGPLTMRIGQQAGTILDGDELINSGPRALSRGPIAGGDDAAEDAA